MATGFYVHWPEMKLTTLGYQGNWICKLLVHRTMLQPTDSCLFLNIIYIFLLSTKYMSILKYGHNIEMYKALGLHAIFLETLVPWEPMEEANAQAEVQKKKVEAEVQVNHWLVHLWSHRSRNKGSQMPRHWYKLLDYMHAVHTFSRAYITIWSPWPPFERVILLM